MKARQGYTSKNTSINKVKVPAIYNKVSFSPENTILDYGCGRYIDHIKDKVESWNCNYWPYDPFNLPGSRLPKVKVKYAVCSNVLNVIDNKDVIKNIIQTLKDKAEEVYITVYEGNGSGIGKVTGPDQYQRNERIDDYVDLIKETGYNCNVKNKVIMIS